MINEITEKDLREAMFRIASTADGLLLYRYLQKVRMGLAPDDASRRALQTLEGRRKFSADLMAHMAEGIGSGSAAVVTFAIGSPRPVGNAVRGAGRRITERTAIAGWDTDDNFNSSPGDAA
jgi:hypothetical protein